MAEADPATRFEVPHLVTNPERVPAARYYDEDFYKAETEAVASHYQAKGKLERIKGEGSVDDIFAALSHCIESEMAAQSSSVSE